MNETNNPILAAILAALNEHIDARIKAALEAQPKQEATGNISRDSLHALVAPMVESMVDAKIEEAISAHQEEYDHDRYDNIANEVDDLPDFDDFVRGDELDSNVRDAVRDLTFDISVS